MKDKKRFLMKASLAFSNIESGLAHSLLESNFCGIIRMMKQLETALGTTSFVYWGISSSLEVVAHSHTQKLFV